MTIQQHMADVAEYLGIDVKTLIACSSEKGNSDLLALWKKYPWITEQDYRDFWSNSTYLVGRQEWYSYPVSQSFARLIHQGGSFLDYGCGTASVAFQLASARPDIRVHLADIAETVTKPYVLWRMKKNKCNFTWFDIPIDEMVDFGCQFDFVRCYDVLEHTFHPLATVQNLDRQIRSQGHLMWTYVQAPTVDNSNTQAGQMEYKETCAFIQRNYTKVVPDRHVWRKRV